MVNDLYSNKADGVLPLILIFLKKENCYIGDICRTTVDAQGNVIAKLLPVLVKTYIFL